MAEIDPHPAPQAHAVAGPTATGDAGFDPGGRVVPAGNGWQWLSAGWQLFRQQPGLWIGIVVVCGVLLFALNLIPVIGSLAGALLAPILMGGVMIGCRAQARGEPLAFAHLFAGFSQNTGSLVMVGVFNVAALALIMIVLFAVVGGSVMMAVMGGGGQASLAAAGSIVLATLLALALYLPVYAALWFAPALITLHGMAPLDALKRSLRGCLKNWVAFLIYGIVGLALAVVASIPFGLGWLVLAPVIAASVYTSYRDIFCAG